MKTLVIASQKGGVGKTTLALNLSLALAEAGVRVLLIDTDPQGAIGLSLSKAMTERIGLAECLAQEATLKDAAVRTSISGFSLLPLGQLPPRETHAFAAAMVSGERIADLLDQAEPMADLCVIDTPCGFGGITLGALRNGDFAVSPIQAEPIAVRSVEQFLAMVRTLNEEGCPIRVAGFIVSMLQRDQPASLEAAREAWSSFPPELMFHATIPRDPVFLEATSAGVPVGLLRHPRPSVTHVFDLIAAELGTRIALFPPRTGGHGLQRLVD